LFYAVCEHICHISAEHEDILAVCLNCSSVSVLFECILY
jgi:hypothetical protein